MHVACAARFVAEQQQLLLVEDIHIVRTNVVQVWNLQLPATKEDDANSNDAAAAAATTNDDDEEEEEEDDDHRKAATITAARGASLTPTLTKTLPRGSSRKSTRRRRDLFVVGDRVWARYNLDGHW